MIGLGDIAYWAFRPVVYLVDWTWGTDLRDCDRCKKRRKLWNSWLSVPKWGVILVVTMCLVALWWGYAT